MSYLTITCQHQTSKYRKQLECLWVWYLKGCSEIWFSAVGYYVGHWSSPLYAVFVLIVSVVRVGRRFLLIRCVHISVCIVCCHFAATETSPADCGDDRTSSQSGVILPVMKGFTRLSRLAVSTEWLDRSGILVELSRRKVKSCRKIWKGVDPGNFILWRQYKELETH